MPKARAPRRRSSAVAASGERLVGQAARRQAMTNAENTIYAVKRLMGRKFDDEEVQRHLLTCPYEVVPAQRRCARARARPRLLAARGLGDRAAEDAADRRGLARRGSHRSGVTVPAYFDDAQRQATKDAGPYRRASTCCASSTSRPQLRSRTASRRRARRASRSTISAAARSISRSSSSPTACSACARRPATRSSAAKTSTTRSSSTCSRCSRSKTAWICAAIAWRCSAQGRGRAREDRAVERDVTEINLLFLAAGTDGQPRHLIMQMAPQELETLVEPLVQATLEPCGRARRRGFTADDIDVVILVGGQTRMPRIVVADMFGKQRAGASIPTRSSRSAPPCRRRAHRRGAGSAAARRHAAVARRRDDGRRVHARLIGRNTAAAGARPRFFDDDRQPAVRQRARAAGRARDGRGQQVARALRAHRHPAGTAACRRSRSRSTSTPTVCSACRRAITAPAACRPSPCSRRPASPRATSSASCSSPSRCRTTTRFAA